jgi:hypothetical protein
MADSAARAGAAGAGRPPILAARIGDSRKSAGEIRMGNDGMGKPDIEPAFAPL